MKAAAYLLVVFIAVVLLVPGFAQTSDDKLIVPGQRIGKWTLDMSINDLVRMNGAPNADGSMGQKMPVMLGRRITGDWVDNVYLHAWHNLSFFVGTLGENSQKLMFLATFSYYYKTAKGLSVITTPQNVEVLYGKPTANTQFGGQNGSRMIYDESGLAARIWGNEVQILVVFRPRTAKRIWNF